MAIWRVSRFSDAPKLSEEGRKWSDALPLTPRTRLRAKVSQKLQKKLARSWRELSVMAKAIVYHLVFLRSDLFAGFDRTLVACQHLSSFPWAQTRRLQVNDGGTNGYCVQVVVK